jgi:ribonuclease E
VLVVLSFVLVLIATVLLVLGLLSDGGLPMIYISIACSAAAGIVLIIAVRLSRPRPVAAGGAPAPVDDRLPAEPVTAPSTAAYEPAATAAIPRLAEPEVVDETVAEEPEEEPTLANWQPEPEPEAELEPEAEAELEPEPEVAEAAAVGEEAWDGFPIADYDELNVSEILPLLPELYSDELDVVEERERQGKARATLLTRITELRDQASADDVPVGAGASTSSSSSSSSSAKKTAAKKTAAKRTSAKKTAAKKTAAKKTAAKKA